jgi:hypothetical protein
MRKNDAIAMLANTRFNVKKNQFQAWRLRPTMGQGLTILHFSAHSEPFLAQDTPWATLNTPQHPLNTDKTHPDNR